MRVVAASSKAASARRARSSSSGCSLLVIRAEPFPLLSDQLSLPWFRRLGDASRSLFWSPRRRRGGIHPRGTSGTILMNRPLRGTTALLFASRAFGLAASTRPSSRFRSWPITEASNLEPDLKEMGLRVTAAEIDGTTSASGAALSDALVSVGPAGRGGTGSFISPDGLIVTNHHVALDAVRRASGVGHDYLNDGFVAGSRNDEISDSDYEVWITRSCVDVSEQLVDSLAEPDPLKRSNLLRDRRQEIAREAETSATGPTSSVRCEVQEMWAEKTYVLFTYERLRDVRLVYVPPMALGCFGGDEDNFGPPVHGLDPSTH